MRIEIIDNNIKDALFNGRLMGTIRECSINDMFKQGYKEIEILIYFKELKEKTIIKDFSGRWTTSNRLCDVHYTISWEGYNA